jgi:hypothetical protein
LAESLVPSHTAALLIAQERREMQARLEASPIAQGIAERSLDTVIQNVEKKKREAEM